MELLRYQIFLGVAVAFLAIWFTLIQRPELKSNSLILFAPVWSIVLLGVYAVASVIIGLISFNDTPEAAAEIDRQVLEAKAEMRKRGIIKDT
mmetsp:Transcript_18889/g.52760  ORF Transcript_18889/g.52760 Transcript_18889/m.52760 type:complete len:92 (-) Transcript_18889:1772-2047(-)